MIINNSLAALRRSTSIITRDGAGLYGLRHVSDDAAVFGVHAFAFADIAQVVAGGRLAVAGAYILLDPAAAAYVGETGNLGRRMQEHALDPSKAFASEVYVVSNDKRRLDKQECLHLQLRLNELIESAGVVRLIKGVGPCKPDLPAHRIDTLDRMLEDALPLLFDAGCRCLWPVSAQAGRADAEAPEQPTPPVIDDAIEAEEADEADDDGSMEIGVTTVPIGVEEQELVYGSLWARGYMHDGGFVVAAGSEMRADANPSANARTLERRALLVEKGAVQPGATSDRYRLKQAVKFPTLGIAGKVLTGAHGGSEKWRPLPPTQPFVIAP